MTETIIGIDLGTTNSEVALVRNSRVEVLDASKGMKLFPSYVGLADDGALLLGDTARNQYAVHPERTIRSIKRLMGSDTKVRLGDREYSPQEISAMILRRLKSIAEAHIGEPVTRAVITVPAFFNDGQRQATRDAGELAGLDVARIINEPTAAALAYEGASQDRKRILVYDLGGGTFDVSVVKMESGIVEVLASHGNNQLGGDDFDQKIVAYCVEHLQEESGVDATTSDKAMARITRAAENAKIVLSNEPYVLIEEEYLLDHAGKAINLSVELTREDYEQMIEGFIDETLDAVHIAMDGAGLNVSELDEILLVGGATRTPLISRRLESALSLHARIDVDPELCVAAGAAIQGAMIAGDSSATVLVDVTPFTFGTSALGELNGEMYPFCFIPVIRKNTPIPVSKTEMFYTAMDDQVAVDVGVYQGEDPDALNNSEIGNYRVEGLRKVAAGNQVSATFSLDLDGILHVTSREKSTGLEKSITIAGAISGAAGDDWESARENINELFSNETDASEMPGGQPDAGVARNREHVQVQAMLEKAERLLADASSEDREDLVNQIEAVKDAMNANATDKLDEAITHLTDLVYYIDA